MSSFRKNFAILVLLAGFVTTESLAQGNPDNTPEKVQTDKIDEVVVMSPRSLTTLRRELIAAEDDMYAIFNSLNTDDDYDIICKKEARVGSQFRYRVCKTKIQVDKASEAAKDFHDERGPQGINLNMQKHGDILREKMRALAAENPQFLDALRKRRALQQEYELRQEQESQ